MYKIEKNVPIPKTSGRGRKTTHDLPDMEVGDSFFVENESSRYLAKLFYQKNKKGYKLTARTENNGVRIWRKA
jgi:hypothetical protein